MKLYTPAGGGNPKSLCRPSGMKDTWDICTAASVPADGVAGYEKGCLLQVYDGASGLVLYVNSGTNASAAFRPLLYGMDSSAVALTATIAELNHSCDRSLRTQAVGGTLDCSADTTEAYNDRTFLLDTASGSALTLPPPAAGYRVRAIVSTAPTGGNSHTITASGATTIVGSVWIHDLDGTTANYYASSASTTITLNATTKGGALGDSVVLEGISTAAWAIVGATLRCATGSNPATPFS